MFRSKRADRLKLIVWDDEPEWSAVRWTDGPANGLILAHKRLENSKFAWPKVADGTMKLTPAQFSALVEGLDWRAVRSARHPRPTSAG